MGLRNDLLNAVLADLPDSTSTLGEPDPRWDALLGGRVNHDTWNWYSRTYGTTCIVATNGWLVAAGAPDDLVVREPTPNGGGTRMIQTQMKGAKARGWYHEPVRGQLPDLKPGYIYNINHAKEDGSDGTHEGIIVSVTPSEDGQSVVVETADGGQGTRQNQYASRSKRTFRLSDGLHPVVVESPSGNGWLDRWFAIGDGEPDDSEGGDGEGTSALAIAAAAAGAGLVLLAVMGWAGGNQVDHVQHAIAEAMWR